MTDPEDWPWTINEKTLQAKRPGLDEPVSKIKVINKEYMIVKIKGYTYTPGARGCGRDYVKSETLVFKILKKAKSNRHPIIVGFRPTHELEVKFCIGWEGR